MNIVAWNMRSGGSDGHWNRLFEAFEPDVVLAQECLPPPLDFERAGSVALWSPARLYPRGHAGSEVAGPGESPIALKRVRWGSCVFCSAGRLSPVEVPEFEGWVKAGDLECADGALLRLVSVHVPGREDGDYLRAANDIVNRLHELPRPDACILGGDFNITTARRRPGEKRQNSRGELAFFDRLEEELGLVSAWDVAGPDAPLPQTLRWTGNAAEPYHCDGFFVPRGWPVDMEVVSGPAWDRLSDHNPVVVRLNTAALERHGAADLPGTRGHAVPPAEPLEIAEEPIGRLPEVASIPISFRVETVLELELRDRGLEGVLLRERAVAEPYVKDYDRNAADAPGNWPQRFDVGDWGLITARAAGVRIGSAVLAWRTPGLSMLEDRIDLALIWDLRVAPGYRGRGIGARLFAAAEEWARRRGCRRLKVETQNTNVPACRFYAGRGCRLAAIDRDAYPDLPHEAQLVWCKDLEGVDPGSSG